jgi:hypothetical protein
MQRQVSVQLQNHRATISMREYDCVQWQAILLLMTIEREALEVEGEC